MKYKIINTGSDGNCILINDEILLDCGVSFKKIEPYYKKLKLVFISHIHHDHLFPSTIKKLALERPTLRFVVGEFLVDKLLECGVSKKNIDVLKLRMRLTYNSRLSIQPIKLYHDVPNFGIRLNLESERLIYMTDTKTVEGIKAKDYDLYLVEGNYDEDEILERIKIKDNEGLFINEYRTIETHLSIQEATNWLLENMGDNSIYEFIHQHKERIKKDESYRCKNNED